MSIMYDVFLSHNRKQKPWVREFYQLLRDKRLSVFFDEDSIPPGANVVLTIGEALEASRHIVLVLSHSSISSKWVALETSVAIHGDPDAAKRMLIPVLIENVDRSKIPPLIRVRNIADLSDPASRATNLRNLLQHLGARVDGTPKLAEWPQTTATTREPNLPFVADIEDITSWGWDGHRLLDELIRLDYETLEGLTVDHEGHTAQWAPVFMDHPETWRLIADAPGSIVGYWHFVPLFDADYELVKQGHLLDSQITTDRVRLFELPGWYNA